MPGPWFPGTTVAALPHLKGSSFLPGSERSYTLSDEEKGVMPIPYPQGLDKTY